MKAFAHRTPRELRSFSLQVISLPGAVFLAVLAAAADFNPGWVRWLVVVGVLAGVAVAGLARFTRYATSRFTIGVIAATMVLTAAIGFSIQPQAIGTLSAFVFLGVAVGASAFLAIRLALGFSAVCAVLGLLVIIARSSIPLVAAIIFVALMTITILVVIVLRQSLQSARDEAVALSLADALTGLANRRSMEVNVPLMSALAERTDQVLGCLVLDLDHFKTVNDTYGHLVGDDVLKVTADALIKATRNSDLCVRVGGDEFSVFTIVRGRAELEAVAERLRAAIEELHTTPPTTVSVGGAIAERRVVGDRGAGGDAGDAAGARGSGGVGGAFRGVAGGLAGGLAGPDADGVASGLGPSSGALASLLRQADRALYEAKSAGRNLVQID